MGYFSNGSEGDDYQEKYCNHCLHGVDKTCRVWLIHEAHNYEQCEDTNRGRALKSILGLLIPRNKETTFNDQCTMFVPEPSPHVPN